MRDRQRKTNRLQRDQRDGRRRSTGQVRRASATVNAPSDLDQRLMGDPAFRVTTTDQSVWFNPFTADAVDVIGSLAETARSQLINAYDRARPPLPLVELQRARWVYEIQHTIGSEQRMRLFSADGRGWLNPFSGAFHAEINRVDGLVTKDTVRAMASVLAICPYATRGIMRPLDELLAVLQGPQVLPSRTRGTESVAASEPTPLENDLLKARDVQAQMLGQLPTIAGYDLGVHYAPQQGVSGDIYDCIDLGGNQRLLVLGDVTGHGIQAALVATTVLKALRLLARTPGLDLVELPNYI